MTNATPSPVGILIQLIDCGALLVNGKLRIANNVDEQHMRYLQLNFLFNLSGHFRIRPGIVRN